MSTHVEQVCKVFGQHQALRDINLTVEPGEFVALLGPSGCGKTTLLRILAGFETPTSGQVRIDEQVVSDSRRTVPTERRNLGMVFQSFALWPHLNVAEHVRFPLRYQRKQSGTTGTDRVSEVLRITGLDELGDRMPHQLSGGQRQRVALARAIAARPTLLLMDEPLSSLDASLREEMRREIQNIHRVTEASIVYVTHDQAEALAMADCVVVMRDGHIEQAGPPAVVYAHPQTQFVATFVGKANLVPGTWDNDKFRPDAGAGAVVWSGVGVAPRFRELGVFPARPDELTLADSPSDGHPRVTARIQNALFQGREIHYTIAVGDQQWQVHTARRAAVGSEVSVEFSPTDVGSIPSCAS